MASGEQIASSASLLPRPLFHGFWLPGLHPRWFPVLWSRSWSPSFTRKGNPREDAEKKVHRIQMLLPETQLGAEAAAGACGCCQVFPSLPFPPSPPPLFLFHSPFFLEGQVLTFHCLLATASTSLSNRSAVYGPHQDETERSSCRIHSHPRILEQGE